MNSGQRKYLIDKLTEKSKEQIKALKEQMVEMPNLSNHVYMAVMNGTLRINSQEQIMQALRRMALNAKEGEHWLSGSRYSNRMSIQLASNDLFVDPPGYKEAMEAAEEHNERLEKKIAHIRSQVELLELRITLASDKTLQRMINEVDDMGDIGLLDAAIKQLSA